MKIKPIYFIGLACFLAGIGAGGFYFNYQLDEKLKTFRSAENARNIIWTTSNNGSGAARLFEPTVDFEKASTKSVNAVVYVSTQLGTRKSLESISDGIKSGSGSGVIISPDGYIITNNHVVDGASEIIITLNDNSEYEATVVGQDPNTDLAVLKIEAENLPILTFANSDEVKIGQWALAIGNPFNLTSTVTAGIVSAKARNIGVLRDRISSSVGINYAIESFIQTDAVVNPGNSGGALVSLDGELIGINTAIATETGTYSGYSFAIPSNLVRKVVDDLITYKEVQRGFIGVNIQNIDARIAREYNLSTKQGAYVTGVTPNGAALNAGIKQGDVIIKIQGRRIASASELQEQVGNFRPGQTIDVALIRGGIEQTLRVTLRNLSGNTQIVKAETKPKSFIASLGASFEAAPVEELEALNLTEGVKVTEVDETGLIAQNRIDKGYIISRVNDQPVGSVMDMIEIFKKSKDRVIIEGYKANGKKMYTVIDKSE